MRNSLFGLSAIHLFLRVRMATFNVTVTERTLDQSTPPIGLNNQLAITCDEMPYLSSRMDSVGV
jgi:hypothetical protein